MEINQRIQVVDENAVNSDFMPAPTVIKVIGVGNGGCNAVNRMIEEGLKGVSFIAMNTDAQMLSRSKADIKVVLGKDVTAGLGAGTDPERGAEAARRDEKTIADIVEGSNLVFVASGFGGGTGTGASPVISAISKASGALTIGVVTKPFEMEGKLRMSRADKGIEQMTNAVDSLIVIPNENLNSMFDQDITFEDSLRVVDDILRQAVQGISDIITEIGDGVNVDFADVETMIRNSNGRSHLGIGYGKGERRAETAITNAFNNPLLDVENIRNAKYILINIVCPKDYSLREHNEIMKVAQKYASDEATIKPGVCRKDDMHDEVKVTVIATGFEHSPIEHSVVDENKALEVEPTEEKNDIQSDKDIDEARAIAQAIKNNSQTNSNQQTLDNSHNRVNIINNAQQQNTQTNNSYNIAPNNISNKPLVEHETNHNGMSEGNFRNQNYNREEETFDLLDFERGSDRLEYGSISTNNVEENNHKSSFMTEAQKNQPITSTLSLDSPNYINNNTRRLDFAKDELAETIEDDDYNYGSTQSISHAKKEQYSDNGYGNIDVMSSDDIIKHNNLFEREQYSYNTADIEIPAFLRRVIQTKK